MERSVILSRCPGLRASVVEIQPDAMLSAGSSALEQVERQHNIKVLKESGGNYHRRTSLALYRTTLNAMMRTLGISRKDLLLQSNGDRQVNFRIAAIVKIVAILVIDIAFVGGIPVGGPVLAPVLLRGSVSLPFAGLHPATLLLPRLCHRSSPLRLGLYLRLRLPFLHLSALLRLLRVLFLWPRLLLFVLCPHWRNRFQKQKDCGCGRLLS